MLKWFNDQIDNYRKVLPQAFWPKIIGYLLGIMLVITAAGGIERQLFAANGQLANLKQAVLRHPFRAPPHLALGKYYLATGDLNRAQAELNIAGFFGSSQARKIYRQAMNRRKNMQGELDFWKQQLRTKTGYRDGYLKLSILYYRLRQKNKAIYYLKLARKIDPNYGAVKQLERVYRAAL